MGPMGPHGSPRLLLLLRQTDCEQTGSFHRNSMIASSGTADIFTLQRHVVFALDWRIWIWLEIQVSSSELSLNIFNIRCEILLAIDNFGLIYYCFELIFFYLGNTDIDIIIDVYTS